jgi:tRNA pseudouridine38-40 synthase
MGRYFIEVAYRGTRYSGFQVQENADTIQAEVEKALSLIQRSEFSLTGSSRTDAGVHARQNFFHFDTESLHPQLLYKLNALLPPDIAIRGIYPVREDAHSRFDATGRAYSYSIHTYKDPFKKGISYYYPYKVDLDRMNAAAAYIKEQENFFAFSKTNTQVKNFRCQLTRSEWLAEGGGYSYKIEGNRFLRGMVRLLTATQLKIGRGKMELEELEVLFKTAVKCGLSVPAEGLFLEAVRYPENYFSVMGGPFT